MLAPTSTRKGACWTGARAHRHPSAQRCLERLAKEPIPRCAAACAISQRMTSISRVPPPKTGNASPALRDALPSARRSLEAQVEDLRARRGCPYRRVGMQADEQVRLVVVGKRRPFVERDGLVSVAREQHAPPRRASIGQALRRRATPSVTSFSSVPQTRGSMLAAMPRIDDHDSETGSRRRLQQRRFRGA